MIERAVYTWELIEYQEVFDKKVRIYLDKSA